MVITVKRKISTAEETIGELSIDGTLMCYTLEDQVRIDDPNTPQDEGKKVYGETAIPYGEYKITLRKEGTIYEDYKKRFADIRNERGTLWIRNIPGFEYVLIHVGNYCKDTLGCLLVGSRIVSEVEIAESTKAYKRIYPVIADALEKGEEVTIEYIRA